MATGRNSSIVNFIGVSDVIDVDSLRVPYVSCVGLRSWKICSWHTITQVSKSHTSLARPQRESLGALAQSRFHAYGACCNKRWITW